MGLKIKISAGYLMLILLLAFVIYLFHGEGIKRNTLKKEESTLADMRRLTADAYMSFLDLSSRAEVAGIWTDSDFNVYCDRQDSIRENLKALRRYIHTPEQLARIDSFNHLLDEKRKLLAVIMKTFNESADVSDLVNEKIPMIVSHVRKAQSVPQVTDDETAKPQKKRNILWNIFHKKEVESAYHRDREQVVGGKAKAKKDLPSVTIPLLRSLNREVTERQKEQQTKLFRQMDSLYENSQTLNRKLNTLIGDFEKEAASNLSLTYEALMTSREESFYIVSGLAAFVFILAIGLYIVVHKDINRRYGYEKALELSDRKNKDLLQSKKSMMLTIAHDLRAPLATIKGCAELLPGEKRESLQNEYAENILHISDYMLGLLNTLIEYNILDSGKLKLNTAVFPLEKLFKEIAGTFTTLARKKNLSLSTTFEGLDTMVSGDRQRIQQIINNLLSNAVKFTYTGYIHIGAQYRNGKLSLFVRDTGIGIDKERQEQIFTAFERGETPDEQQGFGLGLAITYKLVKLLEGTIRVQSMPGHGSTFEVCLPMRETDGRTDTAKILPEYGDLSGMRVLVIDDDRMHLDITQKMYARYGVECDCCLNISELIEALRCNRYDLVLTDMRMAEMDGYGVLTLLRGSNLGQTRTLPVLAVTAQADKKPEHFRDAGFAGCLHKPFSPEELMSVTSCMDRTNFTAIMEGEENTEELLDLFIEDTEKELSEIRNALGKADYMQLRHIIHKAAPLWGMIRINVPLQELEEMASLSAEKWCEELDGRIKRVMVAVEQAVKKAKELKDKPDENHIGSRG